MAVFALPSEPGFDLETVKSRFSGYNKLLSILYLIAVGRRVLPGIVAERWSGAVDAQITAFCSQRGWRELLLRHDKRDETPNAPRGGYIVSLSRLKEELEGFFTQSRIVILLEPRSPYDDQYSINALFQDPHDILLEALGPGFDASDLQRGDVTPHEEIVLRRGRFTGERKVIRREQYRRSVELRLEKIARTRSVGSSAKDGQQYLKSAGHPLLLEHSEEYKPLPGGHLGRIVAELAGLGEDLMAVSGQGYPFVVSMSFLHPDNALVFWDVVWPHLKYRLSR